MQNVIKIHDYENKTIILKMIILTKTDHAKTMTKITKTMTKQHNDCEIHIQHVPIIDKRNYEKLDKNKQQAKHVKT